MSKKDILGKCEECGAYPAIIRFWNKKVLCSNCALKSFLLYLATIGTAAVIAWLVL